MNFYFHILILLSVLFSFLAIKKLLLNMFLKYMDTDIF